jgi:uncharacterized protein (DUF2267 family)
MGMPEDESAKPFSEELVMDHTGLAAFDSTINTTNAWLHEVMEGMGWTDRHRAYHALRAVLHALRDRLPVERVAALGAELPMLVRGFYFEGWHPDSGPARLHKKEDFLTHVAAAFRDDRDVNPVKVIRVVLQVLSKHVSAGEIRSVMQGLPGEVHRMWS